MSHATYPSYVIDKSPDGSPYPAYWVEEHCETPLVGLNAINVCCQDSDAEALEAELDAIDGLVYRRDGRVACGSAADGSDVLVAA